MREHFRVARPSDYGNSLRTLDPVPPGVDSGNIAPTSGCLASHGKSRKDLFRKLNRTLGTIRQMVDPGNIDIEIGEGLRVHGRICRRLPEGGPTYIARLFPKSSPVLR